MACVHVFLLLNCVNLTTMAPARVYRSTPSSEMVGWSFQVQCGRTLANTRAPPLTCLKSDRRPLR